MTPIIVLRKVCTMAAMKSILLISLLSLQMSFADDCVDGTGYDGDYFLCIDHPSAVKVGESTSFMIKIVDNRYEAVDNVTAKLNVTLKDPHLADLNETHVDVNSNVTVYLHALAAGRTEIVFECQDKNTDTCPFKPGYMEYVRREISIYHSSPVNVIIVIVGWIYFAAWSISFYPQIILNFYRRSVVGLNFDFIALNITGFLAYSIFNIGLFWIPEVQNEYYKRHPGGVNPVLLNDVIFSLHAAAATAFVIFQCFILKRGGQRVSYTAIGFLIVFWATLIISLFVAVGGKLAWLDFLYVASYVKLAITLIKYIPQAWFNCRRKSTVGWSIHNILLDFTGGIFSILQMLLLSYNYDDWKSIFGDPTKFGLGLFSVTFDCLFMLQHYVLFRNAPDKEDEKGTSTTVLVENQEGESRDEDIEGSMLPSKIKKDLNDGEKHSSFSDEERPLIRKGAPKNMTYGGNCCIQ